MIRVRSGVLPSKVVEIRNLLKVQEVKGKKKSSFLYIKEGELRCIKIR